MFISFALKYFCLYDTWVYKIPNSVIWVCHSIVESALVLMGYFRALKIRYTWWPLIWLGRGYWLGAKYNQVLMLPCCQTTACLWSNYSYCDIGVSSLKIKNNTIGCYDVLWMLVTRKNIPLPVIVTLSWLSISFSNTENNALKS